MSDDLISRKALFNELFVRNGKACPNNDIDNFPITFNVKDIKQAIRNTPTAYDVDKVVEEIEKIISSYELCTETSLKEIEKIGEDKMSFEICSLHNNRGYLSGLRKALEIVKSGGVAGD